MAFRRITTLRPFLKLWLVNYGKKWQELLTKYKKIGSLGRRYAKTLSLKSPKSHKTSSLNHKMMNAPDCQKLPNL